MIRIFAKAAIAAACIGAAACSPSRSPEETPSESVAVPAVNEPAQPTAAKVSSAQTRPTSAGTENLPKDTLGGCREEPAGDRGTGKLIAMGTFGGVTLYGSKNQLVCSEPGANRVGECELSPNAVAIAKGKVGSRALIGSSEGAVIWYGSNGVSCAKQQVD